MAKKDVLERTINRSDRKDQIKLSDLRGIVNALKTDELNKIDAFLENNDAQFVSLTNRDAKGVPLQDRVKLPEKVDAVYHSNNARMRRRMENKSIEQNVLGIVNFPKAPLALAAASEWGSIAKQRNMKLYDRAIAIVREVEEDHGEYKAVTYPVVIRRAYNNKGEIADGPKSKWEYEPWSLDHFDELSLEDQVLYNDTMHPATISDPTMSSFIQQLNLPAKSQNKLIANLGLSGLVNTEAFTGESSEKAVQRVDVTRMSAQLANKGLELNRLIEDSGLPFQIEPTRDNSRISAVLAAGNDKFRVELANLYRNYKPDSSVGAVSGAGFAMTNEPLIGINRNHLQDSTFKGNYKEGNVDSPFLAAIGRLPLANTRKRLSKNKDDDDRSYNEQLNRGTASMLLDVNKDENARSMVMVKRNDLVLDLDTDKLSLDDMLDGVNSKLKDAGLHALPIDKQNDYAGLPIDLLLQSYSKDAVISALLEKGIDGSQLKDSKYPDSTGIVLSDLAMIDLDDLSSEEVTQLKEQAIAISLDDDYDFSQISTNDLQKLQLVDESSTQVQEALSEEIDKRLGAEVAQDQVEELVLGQDEDDVEKQDNVVSAKTALINAMAGRYVSNKQLQSHLVPDTKLSDGQKDALKVVEDGLKQRVALDKNDSIHTAFDDQHVIHWQVVTTKPDGKRLLKTNPVSNAPLKGEIGQVFLPDKDGVIDLDYNAGSVGKAVIGYNAHFVSPRTQRSLMLAENKEAKEKGQDMVWSKEESSLKFLSSEDGLPYRLRLESFDSQFRNSVDMTLNREITLGIQSETSSTGLNKLYKGKDTYLTRVNSEVILEDPRLIKTLRERVYMDKSIFTDEGAKRLGLDRDDNDNLVNMSAKYTSRSLAGVVFDEKNVAGLGSSHFLNQAALNEGVGIDGRIKTSFSPNSEYMNKIKEDPSLRFGTLLRESENKYQHADPFDRSTMGASQQLHADSLVANTHLALMTYKGYTMDDGSLITEDYAERVGKERAELVAQSRGLEGDDKEAFVSKMGLLPTSEVDPETGEAGFKLSDGDKLSTMHGNKTTISHVIRRDEPGFEMFKENPDLEVVMPPQSMLSRLNMGEVQELMDGDIQPVKFNGETVGYSGQTRIINTEIKAAHKLHVYEEGDGRHVGNQLAWMLAARDTPGMAEEIYGSNGKNVVKWMRYMEVTGVSVDIESGELKPGITYSDADLSDDDFRKERGITVIDPSNSTDPKQRILPAEGGYIKLPKPVALNPDLPESKTQYLPVLPEKLRMGNELPTGEVLESNYTKSYVRVIDKIADGSFMDRPARSWNPEDPTIGENQVSALVGSIVTDKLGGKNGETNKISILRRNVLGADVPNSATAPATNNPNLSMDTIEVGPDIYKNLDLQSPDDRVAMWRDPALHAGSVMGMKVKLNENISGVAMNPVIVTSFGGDFDGDTYGIYAPKSQQAQDELKHQLSLDYYLRDMGKPVEDREITLGEPGSGAVAPELNTGMDFTTGAVHAGIKGVDGEPLKTKDDLEALLADKLQKGAQDPNYDIIGELNTLWSQSQEANIGNDRVDLRTRETVEQSLTDITTIKSKGKPAAMVDVMDRFDRLGYYDKGFKNNVYDHDMESLTPIHDDFVRDNIHQVVNDANAIKSNDDFIDYLKTFKDDASKESISKLGMYLSSSVKADKTTNMADKDSDIEKASAAKQDLIGMSGQSAINAAKVAFDLENVQLLAAITELKEQTSQSSLQVKHDSAIAPYIGKYLGVENQRMNDGGETKEEFLENQAKIMLEPIKLSENDTGQALGLAYNDVIGKRVFDALSFDATYGDSKGSYANEAQTLSLERRTDQSAPIQNMAYSGYRNVADLAKRHSNIFDGIRSSVLVSGITKEKSVPLDKTDVKLLTEITQQVKTSAQKKNREIRAKIIAEQEKTQMPYNKKVSLQPLTATSDHIKKVFNLAKDRLNDEKTDQYADHITLKDAVSESLKFVNTVRERQQTKSAVKSKSDEKDLTLA